MRMFWGVIGFCMVALFPLIVYFLGIGTDRLDNIGIVLVQCAGLILLAIATID